MTRFGASWARLGFLLGLVGTAACGSVSPLHQDGGGGAGTTGAAGTQGTAGTSHDAAVSTDGPDGAVDGRVVDVAPDRPPGCPATFKSLAENAACPIAETSTCEYPEGRCGCLPCAGGGAASGHVWSCRAWTTVDPACPVPQPAVGTTCSTPGQFCTYGSFCSIRLGENVECKSGKWQLLPSPLGTCALRQCAGVDAGADHPPDKCAQPSDCPGGACWQQLDGAKACVEPRATPPLGNCQNGDPACCLENGDCAQASQIGGRCLPLIDVKENFCGGAVPLGNVCRYDTCKVDADCKAAAPTGATVSTCVPSGALNLFNATCIHGGCRTDADCGLHPGGRCQYGQAATNGLCVLRNVFFCAYPSDPCGNADSKACPSPQICVPNADYQGRQCGKGPPQYP